MSQHTLSGDGSGIIKTVILPNEEVNRLAIEAEELRQYLAAQKQVYEDSIRAYDKDRLIREQEFDMKQQEFQETLVQLRDRLERRQAHNYTLTKDFFNFKHLVGRTKTRVQDDYDLAQVENQALKSQLDKLLDAAKNETKYSDTLFTQKTSQYAHRFRKLSKENEEDLAIVKVQYAQVQQKYLGELQAVEAQLSEVIEKGKLMHNRRATERDTFHPEVLELRARSAHLDKDIKHLKALIEEELNEELIEDLEANAHSRE